jgi:hypothetical protein
MWGFARHLIEYDAVMAVGRGREDSRPTTDDFVYHDAHLGDILALHLHVVLVIIDIGVGVAALNGDHINDAGFEMREYRKAVGIEEVLKDTAVHVSVGRTEEVIYVLLRSREVG